MVERCLKIKTKIMHDQANMLRGFSQTIINLEEVRRAVEEYNSQIL
ncbi:MAG: hypothetical protein LBF15_06770 [Candidatus Peribacteria bacterium]|jgi:hypothetical protein|nr:hypothetical protein [Candidatus Peribacteria bacterium]